MDCFFAAAAAVGRPEFVGLPLAVCHSASERGSGEVSSANYEARAAGVGAGMFISEAKRRCPELVVVPYEFDRYEDISMEVCRSYVIIS
jgi:DNA repair protein REV1